MDVLLRALGKLAYVWLVCGLINLMSASCFPLGVMLTTKLILLQQQLKAGIVFASQHACHLQSRCMHCPCVAQGGTPRPRFGPARHGKGKIRVIYSCPLGAILALCSFASLQFCSTLAVAVAGNNKIRHFGAL